MTLAVRPELTMPAPEAEHLRAAYQAADVILEYGSGGSTVMAGKMSGKSVYSVESDASWIAMMKRWFAVEPPISFVNLHHADIGPTTDWGHPTDEAQFRRWPGYALSVWDLPDFRQPDVVLIDGRFRVACLLTTAFRILRPVVALFDDYRDRTAYHPVETLFKPVAMIGRMARFELMPTNFPADRMAWAMKYYLRPA